MPNIKSAKKRVKVIATKTLQNKMIKSQIKTLVKNYEALIAEGKFDEAKNSLITVVKKLDQAVSKGTYHKSTISRKKSRLTKMLNAASA